MPAVRQKYSFGTFEAARHDISEEERARISQYKRREVSDLLRRNLTSEPAYWRTLTEAVEVLYYHPNPIVRHEAAFVLGDFPYRRELEKVVVIQSLRMAMRSDHSIVVKHEVIEALGEITAIASVGAAADMAKILALRDQHHPDIVETAEETLDHLLVYMKKKKYHSAVRTVQKWRNPKNW